MEIEKPKQKKNLLLKMIVLGNYSVGKSSIVKRIFNKQFEEHSLITIGIEFATLEINDHENTSLFIQVWDTSGAEKYKAITTGHLRNADGVILVFDMTNESSITALDYWYDLINQNSSKNPKILLIGNKLDLLYDNFQSFKNEYSPEEEINEIDRKISLFLINKNIFGYVKSSAKENLNIQEPFIDLYNEIINSSNQESLIKNYNLTKSRKLEATSVTSYPYTSSSGCC